MNHIHRIKAVPVHQQKVVRATVTAPEEKSFGWMNLSLAGLALSMLVVYVVQTNLLAAQTWQMRQAQDQLASILEQRNTLVAQQSQLDDRAVLQDLAIGQGFVPAGNIVYLVQDTSVATAR